MHDNKSKLQRRHFLLTVGAGAAAAAAAVTIKTAPPASASAGPDDKHGGQGYTESMHVRNYYRTTQV